MNRAVREALRDAAPVIKTRGIVVATDLAATSPLENEPPALHQAIYTLLRGLPERLPRGSTLRVSTRDRAGGDVELAWEATEAPRLEDPSPRDALRHGPYGDLLDLALLGLESVCRARAGLLESPPGPPRASDVQRRYTVLIPTRSRDPRGRY